MNPPFQAERSAGRLSHSIVVELLAQGAAGQVGQLVEQMGPPVAPGQLADEGVPSGRSVAGRGGHQPGRQRAQPQVDREPGRPVVVDPVVLVGVVVDPVQEVDQAQLGLLLALEHRGLAVERWDGFTRIVEQRGLARRRPVVPLDGLPPAVEGREHPRQRPLGREHGARRVHQGPPPALHRDLQGGFDLVVAGGGERGHVRVEVDRPHPQRGHRLGHHHLGIADAHQQPTTRLGQPVVEGLDGGQQLAPTVGAGPVHQTRVDHEQRHDEAVLGGGRRPGRVVVEPQVPPEPDQADLVGDGHARSA